MISYSTSGNYSESGYVRDTGVAYNRNINMKLYLNNLNSAFQANLNAVVTAYCNAHNLPYMKNIDFYDHRDVELTCEGLAACMKTMLAPA